MNRREFIAILASLAAARARGAAPPATMALGFSLYGMKSLPVAEALRVCDEIGYDAVELAVMKDWPCDPQRLSGDQRGEIRKSLTGRGLHLAALMENLSPLASEAEHQKNLDRLKAAAELGQTLSPDATPVIETILGGAPAQWDSLKERMADRLVSWADVARDSQVTIAVKPHVRGALHSPEGAVWLLERVARKEIRLAYDFSHLQLRGMSLPETIKSLVPHSTFIHVKDARGDADKFEFLLPGATETIDYAEYLKLVSQAGYRGSVVVEVSGMISGREDYDAIAAAKTSYAALAPAFEKAGIKRA